MIKMRLFFGLGVLLFQVVMISSIVTVPPRDTAAKRDSTNVQLNCTSDAQDKITWTLYWGLSINPVTIYPSDDQSQFTSETDGSSIYINTLTDDLAAVYGCYDHPNAEPHTASVASIGYLSCPREEELALNEEVSSECSVDYQSHDREPIKSLLLSIAMLDQQNNVIIKKRATEPGVLSITHNQTTQEIFNNGPFRCKIFFEGDNEESADDTNNLPWYTEYCEFNIFVQQPVSVLRFDDSLMTQENKKMYVDDVVNCTAEGRPVPDINWLNKNGEVLSENGSLVLTNQMIGSAVYTCRATNEIEGIPYSDMVNVSLIVSSREAGLIEDEGVAPWVIAISVLIPLIILLILLALLIYFCLKKRGSQPYKPKTTKPTKSKTAYSSAPTNDVVYRPSTGTAAAYPAMQSPPIQPNNAAPARPMYNNNNNRFANPSIEKYANQDEFSPPEPYSIRSGHGALGVPGLSGSKQDLVGSKSSVTDFPPPPRKQSQQQSYNPNGRNPRPPLSETDSMSPSKRGPSKKKPVPLNRPPSINSNSTTRSVLSSEVTSGGEARNGNERKKKKKGGEYPGKTTSPLPPPQQYTQKSARPAVRKNPVSPPRRQDDSDGSEV